MFYIKIIDGKPDQKPYTLDQVKLQISKEVAILPHALSPALLSAFGFYEAEVITVSELDPELLKYSTTNFKRIYNDVDRWFIEVERIIDQSVLTKAWSNVSILQKQFLLESDWVESSSIVTAKTKRKYKAYRQLLRDLPDLAEYPHQVKLPKAPDIEYIPSIRTLKQKETRPKLDAVSVEKLKDYIAPKQADQLKWSDFLAEWVELGCIDDEVVVSNLISLYTDTTLTQVLAANEIESESGE